MEFAILEFWGIKVDLHVKHPILRVYRVKGNYPPLPGKVNRKFNFVPEYEFYKKDKIQFEPRVKFGMDKVHKPKLF